MKANQFKCAFAAVSILAAAAATAATNAKGSNMKNPLSMSVGGSSTVTLVNEYDPDSKENWDVGVCYIKVKLTKGAAYTIWMQGGDAGDMFFSVDTDFEDESAPFASFDYETRDNGAMQIAYMYADAWDEDDPSSGTYYIQLGGEIGQKTVISFVSGIRSFVQEGEDGNPKRMDMADAIRFDERAQVGDGDFYYIVNLEAGRKYRLWAAGASTPVRIETDQIADLSPETDGLFGVYFASLFPGYSTNNAVAYVVYPTVSGDYVFNISSPTSVSQNFRFMYQAFRKLLPEEHADKVVLSAANGYTAKIMPGRENSDGVYYYDNVIDETLCKIDVASGERWVFDTDSATNSVLMRVYSADGAIVAENGTKGNGDNNVRAAFRASYDGSYYVGVCQPSMLYDDTPDEDYKIGISAVPAEDFESPDDSDDYDDMDDTYLGASIVVPHPGTASGSVVETGAAHGPHVLSARDWYDWFCFAGRGGITYRLKAAWAGEARSDLALRADLYKMVNGAASTVSASFGSLTPGDDTSALTFTADEDAMYYVLVSVVEPMGDGSVRSGLGLDFPAYNLHAVGYINGLDLGLLHVETHGADGTWTLDDQVVPGTTRIGTVQYANGATALVIANHLARVNFRPVDGYTTPDSQILTPSTGEESVFGRYVDSMDPKDDSFELKDILAGGYTWISPDAEGGRATRTLWSDDLVDAYVFAAQEGRSYSFGLKDISESLTGGLVVGGDAAMSFSAYKDGKLVPIEGLQNVLSVEKRAFDAGYVVMQVCHTSESGFEVDSCYGLTYMSANVGTISFESSSVEVGKGDPYVDVVLKRSASEGAVSVRCTTVAGTAKPGEDYYPISEEQTVSWADGDMADKTVRVRLIPSLYDEWTEDRSFQVRIATFAQDAVSDEEYIPVIAGSDSAVITIKSAVDKNPGVVELLDQPIQVTAGDETFRLRLRRTGGDDGRIAIALYTKPGTASDGIDYMNLTYTVVEWADGESGVKEVPFTTYDRKAAAAKAATLGMLAVNADYTKAGYGDYRDCLIPQVATAQTELSIASSVAQDTVAFVSSAVAQGIGISTPIGSWFSDGTLRSGELEEGGSARIGFIVEGPGFLKVDPQVENGGGTANMIYLVGSGTVLDCTDHSGPMVLTVPEGRQTVLFQVNSPSGGAYATFANLDNGLPVKWMPLSSVASDGPLSGAVVPAYGVPLSWTAPQGWNKESLWYRVKLGVTDAATPYQATEETLGLSAPITSPVVAGYITNVVSKLSIGRSSRFYWSVECAYSEDDEPDFANLSWIKSPNVWNFAVSGPGTPATLVSGADAKGNPVVSGSVVELVQGVRFEADLAVEGYVGNISGCVGGTLPPGLSAAGLKISGVPTTPGTYRALVEAGVGSAYGTTTELEFHVAEAGTALGAFGGVLSEDGDASQFAALRNLLLTFSASSSGEIGAAVNYYAGRLSFATSAGFSDYDEKTDVLSVQLSTPVVYDGLTYSNTVDIAVKRGSLEDASHMGAAVGEAKMSLWLRDSSGVPTERTYVCGRIARSNADSEVFAEAMEAFAGYYTIALSPVGPLAVEPSGNGIVTMKVTENGIALFSGTLADGTAISMASYANLVGEDLYDPASCVLEVPLWSSSSDYSLGGTLKFAMGNNVDAGAYADAFAEIEWAKDGASSSYDGAGFRLSLQPVGGWYDTAANLQRYYLDSRFTAETEPVTGIPDYLLYPGLSYVVDTTPHDLDVRFAGNAMTYDAAKLVLDESGRRVDLGNSVNPWNATFAFDRGSGLVTGTFAVISDNGSSMQKYAATLSHKGVLLMNVDPKSPFVDLLTAGFYLMPSSKSGWQISRPFNIRAVSVDNDWSEAELH